eukprot:Gb_29565 [translate_table: standard]
MLGKRPRGLQRTTSLSHIGMDSSAHEFPREKLVKPPAVTVPSAAAPRQVIGYNAKDGFDSGQKKHSLVPEASPRSPLSPGSGLQCLLTNIRKLESGEHKSVGLSIVIEYCCRKEGSEAPGHALESPPNNIISSCKSKPQIVNKSMLAAVQRKDSSDGCKYQCSSPLPAAYNNVLLAAPLPAIDFLDACYLCKRRLDPGRDIYMYRGDKAFCSVDCRWQQILMDERSEKCASAALKPVSASPSRRSNGHRTRVEGRGMATVA